MAHRNRWFTELKNGWIFPWQNVSHNQMVFSFSPPKIFDDHPLTNGPSQDGPEKRGTPDGASSQKAVLKVLALIFFVLASSQRWWICTWSLFLGCTVPPIQIFYRWYLPCLQLIGPLSSLLQNLLVTKLGCLTPFSCRCSFQSIYWITVSA